MRTTDSIDFKELVKAINLANAIDRMPLHTVAEMFAAYSGQKIAPEIVSAFRVTGLSQTDFLMSNFLTGHGIKPLPEVVAEKDAKMSIFELYFEEIAMDKAAKRFYCWLRAEARHNAIHGHRKYKNWHSFRNRLSAMNKNKRKALAT